ncbi:MAG: hypothetical protein J6B13_09150 [Muribaculaceae bacterium]|nr:hypothetical protein [Muribaculaceae bacterium]
MATGALNLRRKNIDLPADTLQKLSLMAVAQGKSLKSYIESVLISKAASISVQVSDNPSPSGDEWYADEANLSVVEEGRAQYQAGKTRAYSMDEIKKLLDI